MSIITLDQQAAGHYMLGHVEAAKLHYDYTAPISVHKKDFLIQAVAEMFPGSRFAIKGSLWDYNLSTDAENREGYFGHYRVQVNGHDYIFCVNRVMEEQAMALGNEIYNLFESNDVLADNVLRLGKEKWSHELNDAHIHLEEYNGGLTWIKDTKITQENGIAAKLGQMAGRVYVAANKASPETKRKAEEYTDASFLPFIRTGMQLSQQGDFTTAIKEAFAQIEGANNLYAGITDRLQTISNRLSDAKRLIQHGNMTEKYVSFDSGTGNLHAASVECACYSYFPMMTNNATYDVGTAVYRILLNDTLYEGSPEEIENQKIQALKDFVKAYNETTDLSLTVEEALEASLVARDFLSFYEIGQYLHDPDNGIDQEFIDHIKSVMGGVSDRLQQIEVLKQKVAVSQVGVVLSMRSEPS